MTTYSICTSKGVPFQWFRISLVLMIVSGEEYIEAGLEDLGDYHRIALEDRPLERQKKRRRKE